MPPQKPWCHSDNSPIPFTITAWDKLVVNRPEEQEVWLSFDSVGAKVPVRIEETSIRLRDTGETVAEIGVDNRTEFSLTATLVPWTSFRSAVANMTLEVGAGTKSSDLSLSPL